MVGPIEAEHVAIAVGAYVLGVTGNLVGAMIGRYMYRRTGRWWWEP